MALDAGIVRIERGQARGVHDVRGRGVGHVKAAGSVALFAAHIPFGDLFGFDVEVYGVAAIAGGAGGSLHVVIGIVGGPPIGAGLDVIREPFLMRDVPLRFEGEIIFTHFGEKALLPFAAVDEGDVFALELDEGGVGFRKIWKDGVGMQLWILNYIGHAGVAPTSVNFRVAGLAGGGAGESGAKVLGECGGCEAGGDEQKRCSHGERLTTIPDLQCFNETCASGSIRGGRLRILWCWRIQAHWSRLS